MPPSTPTWQLNCLLALASVTPLSALAQQSRQVSQFEFRQLLIRQGTELRPAPSLDAPPVTFSRPADFTQVYFASVRIGDWLSLQAFEPESHDWVPISETMAADDAVRELNSYVRAHPNVARAFFIRGRLRVGLKQPDAGLADFDEAIRLNRNDAYVFYCRANAQRAQERLDDAVADYGETIRLDPMNAVAYPGRSVVHMRMNDFAKAADDLKTVNELDPNLNRP